MSRTQQQQQTKKPIKRVAVIGAGPAGAITIDALAQERTFDLIRVFEKRECIASAMSLKHGSVTIC